MKTLGIKMSKNDDGTVGFEQDDDSQSLNHSDFDDDENNSMRSHHQMVGTQIKGKKKDGKQTNTIMQQINSFSLTPMNDAIAEKTIEDHKYLLEHVENRCAIAYFAAANRNLSLYSALQHYFNEQQMQQEANSEHKSPEEQFGS